VEILKRQHNSKQNKISNTKYTEEKFNENKIEKIVKMLDPNGKSDHIRNKKKIQQSK